MPPTGILPLLKAVGIDYSTSLRKLRSREIYFSIRRKDGEHPKPFENSDYINLSARLNDLFFAPADGGRVPEARKGVRSTGSSQFEALERVRTDIGKIIANPLRPSLPPSYGIPPHAIGAGCRFHAQLVKTIAACEKGKDTSLNKRSTTALRDAAFKYFQFLDPKSLDRSKKPESPMDNSVIEADSEGTCRDLSLQPARSVGPFRWGG